jgi:hypothetical protein
MNTNQHSTTVAAIPVEDQLATASPVKDQRLYLDDIRWKNLPSTRKDIVLRGEAAFATLRKHSVETYRQWREVAVALQELRSIAMRITGANDVRSKRYRNEIGSLIKQFSFHRLSKTMRQALLNLTADVDVWYDRLSQEQQAEWNNPVTVLKHYHLARKAEQKSQGAAQTDPTTKTITFHNEVDFDDNHMHSALDFSDLSHVQRNEIRQMVLRFAKRKGIEVQSNEIQTSS